MYRMILECGSIAWVGVLLALIGVVLALIGAAMLAAKKHGPALTLSVVALACVVVVAVVGPVGRSLGRRNAESAVSGGSVLPEMRMRILAVGYREADQCVTVSLYESALPLVLGAAVLVGALSARKRRS